MRSLLFVLALAACTRPNDSLSTGGATSGGSTTGGSTTGSSTTGGSTTGSSTTGGSTTGGSSDLGGFDLANADLASSLSHDLASTALDLSQPGGTVAIGGACAFSSGGSDCVAGAACVARRDTTNGGVCLKRCNGDSDCPSGFVGNVKNVSHCIPSASDPSLKTCSIPCNPVLDAGPSGCAAGLWCERRFVGGLEFTTCTDDESTSSFSCDADNECAPGFLCTDAIITKYCEPWCRVSDDVGCSTSYPYCKPLNSATAVFGYCSKNP